MVTLANSFVVAISSLPYAIEIRYCQAEWTRSNRIKYGGQECSAYISDENSERASGRRPRQRFSRYHEIFHAIAIKVPNSRWRKVPFPPFRWCKARPPGKFPSQPREEFRAGQFVSG